MKSIISRIAVTLGCGLAMTLGGAACSDAPSASEHEQVSTGRLGLPLVTVVNGHTYRLNAQFSVCGPICVWLQTSQDPNETFLSTTLQTGSYDAWLSGWQLERQDSMGNFAPVQSTLVSAQSVRFSIYNDSTTTISFQFQTDGTTVVVGSGGLRVTVGVTEVPTVCTPLGNDCPSGTWCAPGALTGLPLACIPAGTVAVGDACTSPTECVANATCIDDGTSPRCAALCPSSDIGSPCASGGTCQTSATGGYGICKP
ncbi:MAG: hypothetical protein ABW133_20790 [Polyangiaceae bacterium]